MSDVHTTRERTTGDESLPSQPTTEATATSTDRSESDGGWRETSPGSVTLQLEVPPGQYCDPPPYCDGLRGHISIVRPDDGALLLPPQAPPCGYTPCSTCEPPPCTGAACLPTPREVNNETLTWDGLYQELGTCGDERTCHVPRHAPAGRYVARMCATPGRVVTGGPDGDSDPTTCMSSGPTECVEVEFDFPSEDVVVGVLPR